MGESGGDEEEEEGREREREGQAVRILLRSSEGGREARQTDKWRWPLHVLVKFVWPPLHFPEQ